MVTDNSPAGRGGPADAAAALSRRLRHDMDCALELFTVYLGERLGLYRALAADGPATSAELAERTGTRLGKLAAWGGVTGPLLFTAAWVVSSLRQADHSAAEVQLSGLAAQDARDPQI